MTKLRLAFFTTFLCLAIGICAQVSSGQGDAAAKAADRRPNILFAIADDWGWPHASSYGDAVVQTKTFDRIARNGVLFHHAYISSPSCTPSRGAILTGQYHWRLKTGANLYGPFRDEFATYVEILERAGYLSGCSGKAWGPGRPQTRGRKLTGKKFKNFGEFMESRSGDQPFVYWLGSYDPHRPYNRHSGAKSGMDLSKVHMFGHYPDHEMIRGDVADYYLEVQRFDRVVGNALRALEKSGELKNTLVVITGDHGMPFPRCKSNLYDAGTRVPLAVMWGAKVRPSRTSQAFVSLTDLAPTFLQVAGVEIPEDMTGRSLLGLLAGKDDGADRDHVVFGKERHVPSQEAPDLGGYPGRAIRTRQYLYIRNFEPDRWPNGTPDFQKAVRPGCWYGDTDNGPTKTYIIDNRDKDDLHRRAYDLCFAKRPAEELYDVVKDPDQLVNLAGDSALGEIKAGLWQRLESKLRESGDPRVVGGGEKFDQFPYSGGGPQHPSWGKRRRKK
ncbi:MAG: sulfatase [Planctomycetota bacterium]|nr:sulfatase [Planctomycetota bacterium]